MAVIDDIVKTETQNDLDILDVLIAEEEFETADMNTPPQAYCPICKCDSLMIEEIAEGETERGVYRYKCLDCGAVFYLVEDNIASCRRGIANAKKTINNAVRKIEYFNRKSGGRK